MWMIQFSYNCHTIVTVILCRRWIYGLCSSFGAQQTKAHEIHHVASWTVDMSTLISPSIRRFFYRLYDIQMKIEKKYRKNLCAYKSIEYIHIYEHIKHALDTWHKTVFSELFWWVWGLDQAKVQRSIVTPVSWRWFVDVISSWDS